MRFSEGVTSSPPHQQGGLGERCKQIAIGTNPRDLSELKDSSHCHHRQVYTTRPGRGDFHGIDRMQTPAASVRKKNEHKVTHYSTGEMRSQKSIATCIIVKALKTLLIAVFTISYIRKRKHPTYLLRVNKTEPAFRTGSLWFTLVRLTAFAVHLTGPVKITPVANRKRG